MISPMPLPFLLVLLLSVTSTACELPSNTRVRNNNNASQDLIETEEIKVDQEPCSMSMIMSTLAIEEERIDNDGYTQAWPSPFEKLETLSPTPSSTGDAIASIYSDKEEAGDILDRIEDSISVGGGFTTSSSGHSQHHVHDTKAGKGSKSSKSSKSSKHSKRSSSSSSIQETQSGGVEYKGYTSATMQYNFASFANSSFSCTTGYVLSKSSVVTVAVMLFSTYVMH